MVRMHRYRSYHDRSVVTPVVERIRVPVFAGVTFLVERR